jgi:hypothetical protein
VTEYDGPAADRKWHEQRARVRAQRIRLRLVRQGESDLYLLVEDDSEARAAVVGGDLTLDALEDWLDAMVWERAR